MLRRGIQWRWREGACERSSIKIGSWAHMIAKLPSIVRFVAAQLVAPSANPVTPDGLPPSNVAFERGGENE
jgi:hypothetical protein